MTCSWCRRPRERVSAPLCRTCLAWFDSPSRRVEAPAVVVEIMRQYRAETS